MEEQTWHQKYHEQLSFGERLSDTITKVMGSWQFIIWQTLIVLIWMILNIIGFVHHWDVYPLVNIAAKKEIEDIQRQLSKIEVDKLDKILEILQREKYS